MKMGISHFDGQQYRPRSMSKTMTSSESMRMNLRVSSAIESFSSCVTAFQTWNWKPGKITLWRVGGQNWHIYQNYLQVIKKAGEEPVDHYFEHSVYDEKSQLEMEAYSPELTCVTGEEPSTFTVECHGRDGLISFAEWQHDGFAYAISTQYKPLSEEEMKELIYQIW